MTNRDKIWKKANESTDARCVGILRAIFPSMAYDFVPNDSGITRTAVGNREEALKRLRLGLNKITEVEAAQYLVVLNKKGPTSPIKF
jgi:hypothetical protein